MNYATISDLKSTTAIDAPEICKKVDLDAHKIEVVPTDSNKLSNLIKRNVFSSTTYDKLAIQDFNELAKINFDER